MLPVWFLQILGIALVGFGLYDSSVYWRLIFRNQPIGHPMLRLGVVLVVSFYFCAGVVLILFS